VFRQVLLSAIGGIVGAGTVVAVNALPAKSHVDRQQEVVPLQPAALEPPSREQQRDIATLELARLMAAHRDESPDPVWATAAAASLHRDLDTLGASLAFSVDSLDCRSSSCVAKLRWSTYQNAVHALGPRLGGDIPADRGMRSRPRRIEPVHAYGRH
jgi:hypothetical protein